MLFFPASNPLMLALDPIGFCASLFANLYH